MPRFQVTLPMVMVWCNGVGSDLAAISFRFSVFLFLSRFELRASIPTFSAESCKAYGAEDRVTASPSRKVCQLPSAFLWSGRLETN